MAGQNLQVGGAGFEELKRTNDFGAEYWTARELQSLLGYRHWRGFEKAIQKAVTSCQQSGNEPGHHFARARKQITLGGNHPDGLWTILRARAKWPAL